MCTYRFSLTKFISNDAVYHVRLRMWEGQMRKIKKKNVLVVLEREWVGVRVKERERECVCVCVRGKGRGRESFSRDNMNTYRQLSYCFWRLEKRKRTRMFNLFLNLKTHLHNWVSFSFFVYFSFYYIIHLFNYTRLTVDFSGAKLTEVLYLIHRVYFIFTFKWINERNFFLINSYFPW